MELFNDFTTPTKDEMLGLLFTLQALDDEEQLYVVEKTINNNIYGYGIINNLIDITQLSEVFSKLDYEKHKIIFTTWSGNNTTKYTIKALTDKGLKLYNSEDFDTNNYADMRRLYKRYSKGVK